MTQLPVMCGTGRAARAERYTAQSVKKTWVWACRAAAVTMLSAGYSGSLQVLQHPCTVSRMTLTRTSCPRLVMAMPECLSVVFCRYGGLAGLAGCPQCVGDSCLTCRPCIVLGLRCTCAQRSDAPNCDNDDQRHVSLPASTSQSHHQHAAHTLDVNHAVRKPHPASESG